MAAEPKSVTKKDKKDKKEKKKDKKHKKRDKSAEKEASSEGDDTPKLASTQYLSEPPEKLLLEPSTAQPEPAQSEAVPMADPAADGAEPVKEPLKDGFDVDEFWNDVAGEGDDAKAPEGCAVAQVPNVPTDRVQTCMVASGEGTWQVQSDRVLELTRKLEQIALRSGASLIVRGDSLRITGSPDDRERAQRYARVVVDSIAQEDQHPDLTMVPVTTDWMEMWRGQDVQMEQDAGVLIFFEAHGPQYATRRLAPGLVVEAQRGAGGGWRMATAVATDDPLQVLVRWDFDSLEENVPAGQVRPALRLGVFGSIQARLVAQVRLMAAFETYSRGTISARLAAPRPQGGPGLAMVELPIRQVTAWKLQNSPVMPHLLRASGCVAVEFYSRPRASGTGSSDAVEDVPCALLAGGSEQRWLAGQIMGMFAAGMDNRRLQGLPAQLCSECRVIGVPKAMMSSFLGKGMANLVKLMGATSCFIFPLRTQEREGAGQSMDGLLEVMFDREKQKEATNDVAVFGRPLARLTAELKILAQIEENFQGFNQVDAMGQSEALDRSDGLGVDRVWLTEDFEQPEFPRKRSIALAESAGCLVESSGKLVLLGGTKDARTRGREYLFWSIAGRLGKKVQVNDIERRRDLVQLQVPRSISQHPWLLEQLDKLGLQTNMLAFFDGAQDPHWARLLIMGAALLQRGRVVSDTLQQAKALVDKASTWSKEGWDLGGSEGAKPTKPTEEQRQQDTVAQSGFTGPKGAGGKAKGKGKDASRGKGWLDDRAKKGDGKSGDGDGNKGKGKGPRWQFGAEQGKSNGQDAGKSKGKGKSKSKMWNFGKAGVFGGGEDEAAGAHDAMAPPPMPATPSRATAPVPATPAGAYGPHGAAAPFTPAPGAGKRLAPTDAVGGGPAEKKSKVDEKFKGTPPPKLAAVTPAVRPNEPRGAGASQLFDFGAAAPPLVSVKVLADTFPSGVAAPQTPARGARPPASAAVMAPQTPAARYAAAPQTPAGPRFVAAPQTPAGPRSGFAAPQTPAIVAAPQTPAPGNSAPQTPASGFGTMQPQTPALTRSIGDLAAGFGNHGTAAPQTPAFQAMRPRTSGSFRGTPPPAFANAGAAAPRFTDPDHIVPMTPAAPASIVVPQTPALPRLKGPGPAMPPSPEGEGRTAHRTPAAASAPRTPAAISGSSLGFSAPRTPAAIAGGASFARSAPATPAAITSVA